LSVKIRSDEEIDNYNEKLFLKEKNGLKNVDGYTLIDYIKSSVEVLMDMKMDDEQDGDQEGGTHFNSSVRSVAILMSQGNERRKLRRGSVQLKASEGRPSGIKPSKNMDEEIMLRSPKGAKKGKKDVKNKALVDVKKSDIELNGKKVSRNEGKIKDGDDTGLFENSMCSTQKAL